MDQLLCPLCGRRVSLKIFDPELLDSDIYAVSVVGLGRGRGFMEVSRYSVLGDANITQQIAARCREILAMIEGDGSQVGRAGMQAWVDYARSLEAQVASLNRGQSSSDANSIIRALRDAESREKTQRQRADQAECEVNSLRRRIAGLESRIQHATNSNLSLEDGVGLLLES